MIHMICFPFVYNFFISNTSSSKNHNIILLYSPLRTIQQTLPWQLIQMPILPQRYVFIIYWLPYLMYTNFYLMKPIWKHKHSPPMPPQLLILRLSQQIHPHLRYDSFNIHMDIVDAKQFFSTIFILSYGLSLSPKPINNLTSKVRNFFVCLSIVLIFWGGIRILWRHQEPKNQAKKQLVRR